MVRWLPLLLALSTPAWAGSPIALLVGISDYPDDTQWGGRPWSDLHTEDDLAHIAEALRRRGLKKGDIHRITDGQVTKAGFIAAVEEHLVGAPAGSHVFLHYSGHGQQITDDAGADEPDGFDEALVMWGAPRIPVKPYDGSAHLRDDELGALLDRVREAVGPEGSVTVTLDSCNSGSASRGLEDAPVRGDGAPPIGAPRTGAKGMDPADAASDFLPGAPPEASATLAPLVFMSAARAQQSAQERRCRGAKRSGGVMSQALAQTLGSARRLDTWATVFEHVRAQVAECVTNQHPQLEGPAHTVLFDGSTVEVAAYFPIDITDADEVVVEAGLVHGIGQGAVLELRDARALDRETGELLAVGSVTQIGATRAVLSFSGPDLQAPADRASIRAARAFVRSVQVQPVTLAVRLEGDASSLAGVLKKQGLVELVDADPDVIVRLAEGRIVLLRPDDPLPIGSFDAAAKDAVSQRLRTMAHGRLVQALSMSSPDFKVEIDIVKADGTSARGSGQDFVVEEGELVKLRVRHKGRGPLRVTLVLVDPLGRPAQLAGPFDLAPGSPDFETRPFKASLDDGRGDNTLYVLATDKGLDLSGLFEHAKTTTRGVLPEGTLSDSGPLGQLLEALSSGASATRGLTEVEDLDAGWKAVAPLTILPAK